MLSDLELKHMNMIRVAKAQWSKQVIYRRGMQTERFKHPYHQDLIINLCVYMCIRYKVLFKFFCKRYRETQQTFLASLIY